MAKSTALPAIPRGSSRGSRMEGQNGRGGSKQVVFSQEDMADAVSSS
jgi:hypothetical protein